MVVTLNKSEVREAIGSYLKTFYGLPARAEDIQLKNGYGQLEMATWEQPEGCTPDFHQSGFYLKKAASKPNP